MTASTVRLRPIVNWPRSARPGVSYRVTIDVSLAEGSTWPYPQEEFVIGCMLDGRPAFTVEAVGDASVILHRFGGTYGPAVFVVRGRADPEPATRPYLRLTLLTAGGVPFYRADLPVDGDGPPTVHPSPPPVPPYQQVPLAELLDPANAVVPFRWRQDVLGQLRDWCANDRSSLALLLGAGGSGKTRTALELARQCEDAGWSVIVHRAESAVQSPELATVASGTDARVLVVADDVDLWDEDGLVALIRAARGTGTDVHLLLVARSAGEYWARLRQHMSGSQAAGVSVIRLSEWCPDVGSRAAAFHAAVWAFAQAMRVAPGVDAAAWPTLARTVSTPDLAAKRWSWPLNLHLEALTRLLRQAPVRSVSPGIPPESVERATLTRERRHWDLSALKERIPYVSAEQLDDWVAAAALYGAGTADDAVRVISAALPANQARPDMPRTVAAWLREVFPPGGERYWGAAEHLPACDWFLNQTLDRHPDLVTATIGSVAPTQAGAALSALAQAAEGHPRLGEHVVRVVREHPEYLAEVAARLTIGAPPEQRVRLLRATVAAVASPGVSPRVLAAVVELLGATPMPLGQHRVEDLHGLVANLRDLPGTSGHRITLAATLLSLAEATGATGRHETAAAAARESAELYGGLANPTIAHRRAQAAATALWARQLAALGAPDALAAAAQATELYSRLVAAAPEYLSEALPVIDHYVDRLVEVGEITRARHWAAEAVSGYRHRAGEDISTGPPRLALALMTYARLCQPEEALPTVEEAVTVYRRIIADDPEQHDHDLARALTVLGALLGQTGRHADAETVLAEAMERCLARTNLGASREAAANLVLAVRAYADALHALGRCGRAAQVLGEAERRLWPLLGEPPAREPTGWLAGLLVRLAHELQHDGDERSGAQAAESAGDVWSPVATGTELDLLASYYEYAAELFRRAAGTEAAAELRAAAERAAAKAQTARDPARSAHDVEEPPDGGL